jgi:N6-adenosine-specific RNA methylase IME4
LKFNIICADPPYAFSDKLKMSNVKRGAEANYKTLTIDDIKNLKIAELAADDAVLALWVPSAILQQGLDLVSAYGFDFKQMWVWVKIKKDPFDNLKKEILKKSIIDTISKQKIIDTKNAENIIDNFNINDTLTFGMGKIARNVHEICLVGTKGKANKYIKNKSQRTVFFHQNFKHSQKPEILQDKLELIFPDFKDKACEIFARRSRQGWRCIGNECESTFGQDIRDSIEDIIKENAADIVVKQHV